MEGKKCCSVLAVSENSSVSEVRELFSVLAELKYDLLLVVNGYCSAAAAKEGYLQYYL